MRIIKRALIQTEVTVLGLIASDAKFVKGQIRFCIGVYGSIIEEI